MEIQAHGIPEQARVTADTLQIAKAIGAPVVGTNDSHYLEAGHGRATRRCSASRRLHARRPQPLEFSTEEFYVKSAEEMALVFADVPEACRNTLAVAERCNLTLDFGRFHLPKYLVPRATRSRRIFNIWRARGCAGGMAPARRGRRGAAGARAGRDREDGFAGYFLVVWDFIHYARQHGIAVGPGAARQPARWSPTVSGSPTSIRCVTACSSSDS